MRLSTKIALIIFSGAAIGALVAGSLVFSFARSALEQTVSEYRLGITSGSPGASELPLAPSSATALKLVALLIPIFFLTTSVVLLFIIVFVVQPLVRLTSTARAIAEGDVKLRAPVTSRDEIGELTQTFNMMTERLVKLSEQNAAIVRTLPEPLFVLDRNGIITSANRAASFMVGYSERELVGRSLRDMLVNVSFLQEIRDLAQAIEKGITAGKPVRFDEISIKNRVFEIFLTPVQDRDGVVFGAAVLLHDVTHIKEVDRLKTEFVSVASHQLRTPLTAINWYLEILLAGDAGKLTREQREYMGEVYEASKRMVRLINDLLNVSRLDSGRLKIDPKLTRLEDLILDSIGETKPAAQEKKCNIIFQKPKQKFPQIPVDQGLLRQVLQNLLTNAVRYSPSGGCRVEVELGRDKHDDILITVRDEGIGVPESARGHMFEKFFRADNAVQTISEGTGLGLYIAKLVIETAGGKIWFESKEGQGTTFYLTIPKDGMKPKEGELGLAG